MTVTDLIAARNAALARGDKALGRELYHQLIARGYRPEEIDAAAAFDATEGLQTVAEAAPEEARASSVEAADEPEPPETTQAPEPPDKAVKPAPRRRKPAE